jgi:hypothetical protein
VHVDLQPHRVEARHCGVERIGGHRQAALRIRMREIGGEQCRRLTLEHAVDEDLDRLGVESRPLDLLAVREQRFELVAAEHPVRQRQTRLCGQLAALRQRRERHELVLAGGGLDERGDAGRIGGAQATPEPFDAYRIGGLGYLVHHEIDGRFAQGAAGLAGFGVVLDDAVLGVGRFRIDPDLGQRARVCPTGVTVGAHQDHGTIGKDLVQQLLGRAAVLEQREVPAAANDPAGRGLVRARCDLVEDRLHAREFGQRTLHHLQTGRRDVHVGVVEARQCEPVGQIDDDGLLALVRGYLLVRAHRDDTSCAHGGRLRPRPLCIDGVDAAVQEHGIRGSLGGQRARGHRQHTSSDRNASHSHLARVHRVHLACPVAGSLIVTRARLAASVAPSAGVREPAVPVTQSACADSISSRRVLRNAAPTAPSTTR